MAFPNQRARAAQESFDPAQRLAVNAFAYQRLLRQAERLHRDRDSRWLPYVERVAEFAWRSHPGRLADGALENMLIRIGQEMHGASPSRHETKPHTDLAGTAKSRTLHVASQVYPTGGHSRVLGKWIERDRFSHATLVLTRQEGVLPPFLTAIAEARGASITILDRAGDIVERARQLRGLSRDVDRVILHHHPDDAVPVLAYAAPNGPPVALFNHAHFWFSLGSGVADVVINTMPYFQRMTERYRFARTTDILDGPFGLDPLHWEDVDKRAAKAALGLVADRPVAMSIGFESYFAPFGDMDFFATIAALLAVRADLQIVIVGVRGESDIVPPYIRADARVRFTGPVPDPRPYYRAADICLESFPMPSLGALTEAVAYGQAFPVPAYAEQESPLHVNQQRIASITPRTRTQEGYVRHIAELLDTGSGAFERAGELRKTLIRDDTRFGDQFAALYERIDRLGHAPHLLPRTTCEVTPETLALASLTNPDDAIWAINHLLPPLGAIAAHGAAIARGYEKPRAAMAGMARRLAGPIVRRLPRNRER